MVNKLLLPQRQYHIQPNPAILKTQRLIEPSMTVDNFDSRLDKAAIKIVKICRGRLRMAEIVQANSIAREAHHALAPIDSHGLHQGKEKKKEKP